MTLANDLSTDNRWVKTVTSTLGSYRVTPGFDRVPLSQFSTAGSRSRRTASWIVLILIGVADPDLSLLSAPASVGCRPHFSIFHL